MVQNINGFTGKKDLELFDNSKDVIASLSELVFDYIKRCDENNIEQPLLAEGSEWKEKFLSATKCLE